MFSNSLFSNKLCSYLIYLSETEKWEIFSIVTMFWGLISLFKKEREDISLNYFPTYIYFNSIQFGCLRFLSRFPGIKLFPIWFWILECKIEKIEPANEFLTGISFWQKPINPKIKYTFGSSRYHLTEYNFSSGDRIPLNSHPRIT